MDDETFPGWFLLPIRSYHGRIPHIIVDLLNQLRWQGGVQSPDLFDVRLFRSSLWDAIHDDLNSGPVTSWRSSPDIATLSVGFLRYLSAQCATVPLLERPEMLLVVQECAPPPLPALLRRGLRSTHASVHRTLAFLFEFLQDVASVSEAGLYSLFEFPIFGRVPPASAAPARAIFHAMRAHYSEVFPPPVLSGPIVLTDTERDVLMQRWAARAPSAPEMKPERRLTLRADVLADQPPARALPNRAVVAAVVADVCPVAVGRVRPPSGKPKPPRTDSDDDVDAMRALHIPDETKKKANKKWGFRRKERALAAGRYA